MQITSHMDEVVRITGELAKNGGDPDYEAKLQLIRDHCRRGGFTFADVGLTEGRVTRLKKAGAVAAVRQWMRLIKAGKIDLGTGETFLREELGKSRLRFEATGMTEEAFAALKKDRAKKKAAALLRRFRRGGDDYEAAWDELRRLMAGRGLGFADLGLKEEDVGELRKLGAEKTARRNLKRLRDFVSRHGDARRGRRPPQAIEEARARYRIFLDEAGKSGLSFQKFGVGNRESVALSEMLG